MPPTHAEATAFYAATKDWDTDHREVDALPATNAEVRNAGRLGAMLLVVLTAASEGLPPVAEQEWRVLQGELAALSTNSHHRTVAGTTHLSLLFSPTDAQVTSAAIREVIEAVRTQHSLQLLVP